MSAPSFPTFTKPDGSPLAIAALVFPGFTLSDLASVYTSLNSAGGDDVTIDIVGPVTGPVPDEKGRSQMVVARSLDEVRAPDVILVPGGDISKVVQDPAVLGWLARWVPEARAVVSVCFGSALLAASGVLDGRRATAPWFARPMMANFPKVTMVDEHVVTDGNITTVDGISGAIEAGLQVIGDLLGPEMQEIWQLCLEYDPEPAFATAAAWKAPEQLMQRTQQLLYAEMERVQRKAQS